MNPLPVVDPAADRPDSLSVTDWGAMTTSLHQQHQQYGSGADVGHSPATVLGAAEKDNQLQQQQQQQQQQRRQRSRYDDDDDDDDDEDGIAPRAGSAPRPTVSAASPGASPVSASRKPTHAAMSGWRARRRASGGATTGGGGGGGAAAPRTPPRSYGGANSKAAGGKANALDEYIQTHERKR